MRVDYKEPGHGPFRGNFLQRLRMLIHRKWVPISDRLNNSLNGLMISLNQRQVVEAPGDEDTGFQALASEVSGLLGGSFSMDQSADLIAKMGALFRQYPKNFPGAALQVLDTALLLCKEFNLGAPWMLETIRALPGIVAENPDQCVPLAASVLEHFADCVADLPSEACEGIIEPMVALFQQYVREGSSGFALALQALDTAFLLYGKSDPKPEGVGGMLNAIQALPNIVAANPDQCVPLAASVLEHFADCVADLPSEACEGIIEPMVALFQRCQEDWSSPDAAVLALQALRTALLLLRHTEQGIPQFIPDALNAVAQLELEELAFENKAILIHILAEFGEYIQIWKLSDGARKAFAEVAIDVMNGNGDLGLKAFRVLCAFAQREPDVAMQIFSQLFEKDRDAAMQLFSQLFEKDRDAAMQLFLELFAKAPDTAVQVFSRLLAYKPDVAMQAFSQALDMLKGQAGELGDKLAAINGGESQDGEAKLEAYDEAMQLFEGYASTLAGCIGQVPAGLRGSLIGQIKGEFDAAYRQMQAGGSDEQRFVEMKVAHELLKLWGLLLLPPGSIYAVLDAVVEALNKDGKYYFSCRGDAEWRRIHTKDPEVYRILARTDLALVTGKAVQLAEMTADTVRALNTVLRRASAGVGARTCDSYTQVVCSVLGEVQNVTARVIAEMQQKLRMTGGRDNLMGRIEEYIALARGALEAEEGAQVFGIGYQGYGKRGTLVRNEHGNAATLAIGAPTALEMGPREAETRAKALVTGFRAAIEKNLQGALAGEDDEIKAVIDVITVIGTSHILTPAMVGTFGDPNDPGSLGLHRDAQTLCNFLQITEDSMIKRLDENDRQASLMLGEGLVKSPEGTIRTDGEEFAEASGAFTRNAVRISEGLFREVFQLRNQLAKRDEQLAKERKACRAATARLAKEKARAARRGKRLGDVFKEFQEISNSSRSDAEKLKATTRMLGETMKEAQGSPPPSSPFALQRPPVSGASGAARALRSGETLLTLATFLTDCNRIDQDMWGDGWCGFYAILSQTDQRFAGAALATWNGAQGAQAAVMVLQQALRYGPWDQLDTERLQRVAQHTRRAVVLMDTMGSQGGYDVKQIDLAIPISAKEAVVLTVASLDTLGLPFLTWLMSFLVEAKVDASTVITTIISYMKQHLPADVDINTCTVLDVIRGLLINPQTIGLSHPTANHFHALQPQGAGAWPEDQTR